MKLGTMRAGVLLAAAMMLTVAAGAQQRLSTDLGLTFNVEHSQVAQTGTPGFWLKGGSIDGAFTFYHGLGLAANFTGGHANITPGVRLGKYSFMAGPRYTSATKASNLNIFGEALFGMAHGFDGLFPSGTGVNSTANSLSLQIGGGVNLALHHGFGVRPLEMDYVRTSLPNNASNSQNDLRFAFGLTYHLGH